MGTKWQVWSSAGEKCVLLYHRKGNAIQYAALYVHSFPCSCPQKTLDSEKFHSQLSTPEELKTTADKLRYYRYQKSLLQREVAAYAGINESTYIDYESGKRDYYPFAQIERIADLLGVTAEALLDDYNLFLCEQGESFESPAGELPLDSAGACPSAFYQAFFRKAMGEGKGKNDEKNVGAASKPFENKRIKERRD